MRRIVAAGHEIASHGYAHDRVFTFTPAQFAADIDRARKLIEDTSGAMVSGYRAPSFSIDERTPWAHEILAEKGYTYSSSVAPVKHDHYGWATAPRFAFRPVSGSDFLEIPVTTAQLGPKRLAAGGGGFFRLLPYQFSRWAIRQVNEDNQRPAIIYFHPWEIDPGQPRVANAPLKSKFRHYTKLDKMAGKLSRLAREFQWERLDAIAAREQLRFA
jgi:polysaccharide deacetylase family protein (PEP-CTERM system associated)